MKQAFKILIMVGYNRCVVMLCVLCCFSSCKNTSISQKNAQDLMVEDSKKDMGKQERPNIDLSHWKLTLPIGKPTEVSPPEILQYRTNEMVKKYMYDDPETGALVFYTTPDASTANSKYSRSELREQMEPRNDKVNWTFADGGEMEGTLAVKKISKDEKGKWHRTIVMQIHGRLTNEQKKLIGQKDNNAPPMLKIYWLKGKIRVKTKKLKDASLTGNAILKTDAWIDAEGHTFKKYVGNEKFSLKVVADKKSLTIILNDGEEKVVYDSESIKKWGIFENYFKAGNYLMTTQKGAYASVHYYDLKVTH